MTAITFGFLLISGLNAFFWVTAGPTGQVGFYAAMTFFSLGMAVVNVVNGAAERVIAAIERVQDPLVKGEL